MNKNHLGNVRMVVTEDEESDVYPTLTFEGGNNTDAEVIVQNNFWENKAGASIDVIGSRTPHISDKNGQTYETNAMLVRKSTGSIGAGKLLKVMAGDEIHTSVEYFYSTPSSDNSDADALNSLVGNIVSLIGNSMVPGGAIKGGATDLA
ncbi:MAG TPA: hypothetical protein VIK80_09750, partial [Flavihumibacter sp.]